MKKSTSRFSTASVNDALRQLAVDVKDISHSITDAELYTDIALTLYRLRKERGLYQKDLAARLGIQQSNVSRYETPGYSGYTLKLLRKYTRELGAEMQVRIVKKSNVTTVYRGVKPVVSGVRLLTDSDGVEALYSLRTDMVTTVTKSNNTQGVTAYASR